MGRKLPPARRTLADLKVAEAEAVADAYAALSALPANPRRRIGPTAAAKMLHVLRPAAVPAWDAAIARRLHRGTGRDHFRSHVAWGQTTSLPTSTSCATTPSLTPDQRKHLRAVVRELVFAIGPDAGQPHP